MTDATTIKVPRALRERIAHDAARRGVTAARLIGDLMDRYEREQRLGAVGEAYAQQPGGGCAEENAAWDQTLPDGLTR